MKGKDELPQQVKDVVFEFKKIAELDPIGGSHVLVGQNGYLEKYDGSFKDSFVGSGLIEPKSVSLTLRSVGSAGDIFHHVGKPELWEKPKGESGYEVESYFGKNGVRIEAFVVEREDPTTFITFEPRQDFTIFYSLFGRIEDANKIWDDHMRGVNDVIKFERNEMLSRIRIMKNYILDYLFVRKKALLIGYYFSIVTAAQDDVPDDFFKRIELKINRGKASITIAKPRFSLGKLIARLDMFKVIPSPNHRVLGNYGTLAEAPKITLKTTSGLVEMRKFHDSAQEVSDFLSLAYFSSEVLKKYEDDTRYFIDDNGGVHYAGVWGIFRGIQRLGDEVIAAHVGDVAEGLPYEEWEHWASYNIDPLSTEEHRELLNTQPTQQLLNALASEMESFENKQLRLIETLGVKLSESPFKYQSPEQKKEILRELKKTFTSRTTRNEFLNRTVELYKLCVDSLNMKWLTPIIDRYDSHAKFDARCKPKGPLRLFITCLEFETIEKFCIASGLTKEEVLKKSVEYYSRLQRPNSQDTEDFLFREIKQRLDVLKKAFSIFFALHAFRSKAGGAHLGSPKEFISAIQSLGFTKTETNFLKIYRTLITRLTQFFFQF